MAEEKKKAKAVITKLIMVNLHMSHDTGNRTLKTISKKVAEDNKADVAMIRTTIKLIPPKMISEFTNAMSRVRTFYLDKTLPWEDGNWRVIPVTKFNAFKDDIEKLIAECKDAYDRCFIRQYDKLKSAAEKARGNITVEFPSKEELQGGFKVQYNIGAIASVDDPRIDGIDTMLRKKIVSDTEDRYNEQIDRGLKQLAQNLSEALKDLAERVAADDQKGKKYTRFMANLGEMCKTARDLNITGNNELSDVCENVEKDIACWSTAAIKDSEMLREHIKDSAGNAAERLDQVTP